MNYKFTILIIAIGYCLFSNMQTTI